MFDGMINVYKEKGYTSHDVVAKLRGILKQKKIGHTGTLDPDAVGVLPVCLGTGTKLCDMLTDKDKVYEAVLLLGKQTDTLDISGEVIGEVDFDRFSTEHALTEEIVREVILSFVGKQMQIPPMYSALKVNGKKLYELARAGVEVERKAREIEVFSISILKMELPRITLSIHCSKGTYIRSLCDDIGTAIGCGGCMESLIRTKVGIFTLENAKTLAEIEQYRDNGQLENIIRKPDEMFDAPKHTMRTEFERYTENGNCITKAMLSDAGEKEKQILVYHADGTFVGVYEWDSKKKQYRPEKIFFRK
ncbi:MAG: tRNA pseudouridine(55) synthase TruB [Lachnospiraceae bacterium]|nr:tRNA pseudouridine(55) synthase TruB [Lachnospiraceae bacterium]